MGSDITIFRKRHIPDEIVELKDDVIVRQNQDYLITKWNCIRPRDDMSRGISAYFINDGYKVSKMYDADGNVVYWYCDIMTMSRGENEGELIYEDMLLDVIVYNDGHVEVVDADEFAKAIEEDMIEKEKYVAALKSLDRLLKMIYSGKFKELTDIVESAE